VKAHPTTRLAVDVPVLDGSWEHRGPRARPHVRRGSSCPSIVPELSPSSVYSRRFPSSGPSRKSLSCLVWPTRSDDGLRWVLGSNPVGDASSTDRFDLKPRCSIRVAVEDPPLSALASHRGTRQAQSAAKFGRRMRCVQRRGTWSGVDPARRIPAGKSRKRSDPASGVIPLGEIARPSRGPSLGSSCCSTQGKAIRASPTMEGLH